MDDQLQIAWITPERLTVGGELDLVTGPLLLDAKCEHEPPAGVIIEMDLSAVTFIDSTGLRALIEVHRRGIQLRLTATSRTVANLLSITGVGSLFGWDEYAQPGIPTRWRLAPPGFGAPGRS